MVVSRGYRPRFLRAPDSHPDQTVISTNADATHWKMSSRGHESGMCLRAQIRPPAHPRRADGCRALVTFAGLIVLQLAFVLTMRRRIGPESPTPADLLTGSRVVCAAGILTAAVTGPGVHTQEQQRRLFVLAVLTATVTDWCD